MNTHGRDPPRHVQGVGNFELVDDVLVEHAKACSVDVGKREVVILVTFKAFVGLFDHRFGGKVVVHSKIAWIGIEDKRHSWLN